MALIKCSECGNEVSEKATSCPKCGSPILANEESDLTEQQMKATKENKVEKGTWAKGKLAIGIISMFLFIIISFQSCAAGLSNTLSENGSSSGMSGFMMAVFMFVAGIVGILTRNSNHKGGTIATIILYWIGALAAVGTGSTFGDLPIWGMISFIFGFVFLGSLLVNLPIFKEGKNKKIFKIVFGALIVMIGIIGLSFAGSGGDKINASNDQSISDKKETKTIKRYGINETFIMETSEGSYKLTITGVKETKDRNEFSDIKADKVVLISYNYENIDVADNIYIMDMSFKAFDKSNNSLEIYPAVEAKSGESVSSGRKTSAVMALALNNEVNYLEMEFYDNLFNSKSDALFILEW
ncbi:MAG: zinc-ribbon domain-containing protein [Firmicutes bacterium]|nr:zinc-ribbon domain-containing protein [Bacillota bacterium]